MFTRTLRHLFSPRRLGLVLTSAVVLTTFTPATAVSLDVPYIKTPDTVVDRMLEMGRVGPDDFLIDLGSGDGRIPIAAARKFGTRGLGVDLDPARTEEAVAAAQAQGVADRVTFRTENLFDTDLSEATVITMYLFPEINLKLRPHLLGLKPGTRIVAHAFHMDEWTPQRHDIVENRDIFLWTIPARVEGLWRVRPVDGEEFVLRIWQQFDRIQGTMMTVSEQSIPLADMKISGAEIQFRIKTADGEKSYTGTVDGSQMKGTSPWGNWTAKRM